MDSTVDDDICILTHEKADCIQGGNQDMPFSASSEEASVASHFALVTAYEDIKKRLKATEKENYSLKRKLRLLEEKLSGTHEEKSNLVEPGEVNKERMGREHVNKAYNAYRVVCIERDNLIDRLHTMENEKLEATKILNEQLQLKEVELLQVRSELETQQVMTSLNKTPSDWEIDKLNSELKIRSVEQELKLLQEECRSLKEELQRAKETSHDRSLSGKEQHQERTPESESSVWQAYWELKKEMSNLHLVTEVQAEVLRKLKASITATKKGKSHGPVQCEEDLVKNCSKLRLIDPGATYEKVPFVVPNEHKSNIVLAVKLHGDSNYPFEQADCTRWTSERHIPVGGPDREDSDSFQRTSFEDNSWVMPSPPKPSETLFWETKKNSPANYEAQYYTPYDNQNYSFKS
ncbi:5-azacytidine-induced protein 2 [Rhinophrynus dorsalis]